MQSKHVETRVEFKDGKKVTTTITTTVENGVTSVQTHTLTEYVTPSVGSVNHSLPNTSPASSEEAISTQSFNSVKEIFASKPWWYIEDQGDNAATKYQVIPVSQEFKQECVDAHNTFRKMHGVPLVQWSDELHATASQWAQQLASLNRMEHSNTKFRHGCGENLAWKWVLFGKNDYTATQAVTHWYNEIKDYNYETHNSENSNPVGHFTQVVWKDCTHIGMAWADDHSSGLARFYVCHYCPPGNIIGQYPSQVFKPQK